MSYRSKRTRALLEAKDSQKADNTSHGPAKKASFVTSKQSTLQPKKETLIMSPTPQKPKPNATSDRWGPFNPPHLKNFKTSQLPLDVPNNGHSFRKSVSGSGQLASNPDVELDVEHNQNNIPYVASQLSNAGGIWKAPSSGWVHTEEGEDDMAVKESLNIKSSDEKNVHLPPKFPKKAQPSKKHNLGSTSHQPLQEPSLDASHNADVQQNQNTSLHVAPQVSKVARVVWTNSSTGWVQAEEGKDDVVNEDSLNVKSSVEKHVHLPPKFPPKNQPAKKHNVGSTSHQPRQEPSLDATPNAHIEYSITRDEDGKSTQASQCKVKEKGSGVVNIREQASKFRRHMVIPSCLPNLEFDDNEEVLIIGKYTFKLQMMH